MSALTHLTLPGLGKAKHCSAYPGVHRPVPVRFVWHHILPQICGGPTEPDNLVSLCDNCHYAVHALMYRLASAGAGPDVSWPRASTGVRGLALDGLARARAKGTVAKIPDEGGGSHEQAKP